MKTTAILLCIIGLALFSGCSKDDIQDKDSEKNNFPTEDPTDPDIVRTIKLTVNIETVDQYYGTIEFDLDYNKDYNDYNDYVDNYDIQDVIQESISFPMELLIDWGDGSITNSNSHRYTTPGKYNIVIKAKKLRWFSYVDNRRAGIISADFKECNSLVGIKLGDYDYTNKITTLDLSGLTVLKYLDVHKVSLKSLNVNGCSALMYLDCSYNDLETINIETCKQLVYFDCSVNDITTLNVSGYSSLRYLACDSELTSLTVHDCPKLNYLECHGDESATLDLAGCPAITDLHTSGFKIKSMNVLYSLPLEKLSCGFSGLDLSRIPTLKSLSLYGTYQQLVISGHQNLTDIFCYDVNKLEISRCPKFNMVYGYAHSKIGTLKISSCNSLEELRFYSSYGSQCASLLIAECTALRTIDLSNMDLKTVNVSNCPALHTLDCSNNSITSVSLTNNNAITTISLKSNQLDNEALNAVYYSLPDHSEAMWEWRRIYITNNPGRGNVSIAENKGWYVN